MILPDFIADRIPGARTVVQADFMHEGKSVVTVRAGTQVSLDQQLSEASRVLFFENHPGGTVRYKAERRIVLPFFGDKILYVRDLGANPEGYESAVNALPE
ncbi:hypothetical protein HY410_00565 [Candidatus Gottesmanbacteria bacterium]|nr:hypothetical protein [Candidatus Gottesmanbacteria bacterium]